MHEAKAAGCIYQAVIRSELTRRLGVGWAAVDARTGMADIAGFSRDVIEAWSQRHNEIDSWVSEYLEEATAGADAVAQKETLERKDVAGVTTEQLRGEWREDPRAELMPAGFAMTPSESPEPPTIEAVLTSLARTRSTWRRAHVVETVAAWRN